MTISLKIIPASNSVDIFGSAPSNLNTSYSLSGHILLSLSPSTSYFDSRPRSSRILLTSLEVILEGKAESIASQTYAGARVCQVVKQLLPDGGPLELECNNYEPASWQIVFDLALPGWLPASTICGEDDLSGVSYTILARATYHTPPEDVSPTSLSWNPWKLASLFCSAILPRDRTIDALLPIIVNRYPSQPSAANEFAIKLNVPDDSVPTNFPSEVLTNLQALVTLPSYIDTTDETVPVSLALRFAGDSSLASKLRIPSFKIDLEQHERIHRTPKGFAASYPIPAEADQPPHYPLLDAHPLQSLNTLSLICGDSFNRSETSRTWSIVQPDHPTTFKLRDDLSSTPTDGLVLQSDAWHKITSKLPIKSLPAEACSVGTFFDQDDHLSPGAAFRIGTNRPEDDRVPALPTGKARRVLRPSYDSPFFTVRHEVRITITCAFNDNDASTPANEIQVSFSLPIRFSSPLAPEPPVAALGLQVNAQRLTGGTGSSYPRTHPLGTNTLPAYSQLFHSNGDWRDEVHADLPAYSKEDNVLVDVSTP